MATKQRQPRVAALGFEVNQPAVVTGFGVLVFRVDPI
ncbi:hypothetical protein COLO4_14028 [Corchorus olitorius]|uniref:Uncharacterized protein n=1 Tax=Corchorus olitorius TaxID=93759 RepID=A0A1R3JU19_9ROSI|nr:hypothetical protein COLO4_14028 [Corchorus olitorius]